MKHYREPTDALDLAIRNISDQIEECVFTRVRFFDEDRMFYVARDIEGDLPELREAYALRWCGRPDCPHNDGSEHLGHAYYAICPLTTRAVFRLVWHVDEDGCREPQYRFERWVTT